MASESQDAGHAAGQSAEYASSSFPAFEISTFPSQIFWLAISFVILYVVLSRVILPKMGTIIEQRRGRIASDLDGAARMKSEADEALAETDKQLALARASARAKAEQTRAEIDARIAKASAAKAVELDARLKDAEVRIDTLKTAAMSNVADIASSTTSAILGQLGFSASDAEIKASVEKSTHEVAA